MGKLTTEERTRRIVVAITGATGVIYGIRLLQVLRERGVESHLILSEASKQNVLSETTYAIQTIEGLGTGCTTRIILPPASRAGLSGPRAW